jgi:phage replication-related protein YjqB (UPF0714/DUF867 family)
VVFAELLAHPDVVEELELRSAVGFLALHGGLEPGTAELARTGAARAGASCYTVSQPRDLRVHVPSVETDPEESPRLASFLAHVHTVVSVHGYYRPLERPQVVLVGGANRDLVNGLAVELRAVLPDYQVIDVVRDVDAVPTNMRGLDPRNPVNRTARGGVQLELPHHLRAVRPSRFDSDTEAHQAQTATMLSTLVAFIQSLDR